jgi:hypothetical protein
VPPTLPAMDGAETEDWFAQIDASVNGAAESDQLPSLPHVPIVPPATRTSQPMTHMEMLQRVWLRHLKILFVVLLIAAASGFGFAVAVNLVNSPVDSPAVSSPARPVMPTPLSIPNPPEDPAPAAADTAPATP